MGLRPDIPCKKHKNSSIELYATIANTKRGCAYFDTPSFSFFYDFILYNFAATSFMVIRFAFDDGHGTVNLLDEDEAYHLMGEGHL